MKKRTLNLQNSLIPLVNKHQNYFLTKSELDLN